jgi:hypothetical protein
MSKDQEFRLRASLGPTYRTDPEDVLELKKLLLALGYYSLPDQGVTEFPDRALFNGVREFQKKNGLKIDGVVRPGGPTEKALAASSPRYRCIICGALHGGVYSPLICHQCWVKM